MKTQWISFDTKEDWLKARLQDVTSTEVSALFNLSPYMTAFELWHKKKAQVIDDFEPNERMTWGLRLEEAIAKGIAEDRGWKIRKINRYGRLPELRLGASYDYQIMKGYGGVEENGAFEAKNVDWLRAREVWIEGDDAEAPPHIEIQIQQEMLVGGFPWGCIGALVGGNEPRVLIRKPNQPLWTRIKTKVARFWESIENNTPPAPDFAKDRDLIRELHLNATEGKLDERYGDETLKAVCDRRAAAAAQEKSARTEKEAAAAEVLTMIGDAEKVLLDGYSISAKTIAESERPATVRKAYRNLRITKRKEKADNG